MKTSAFSLFVAAAVALPFGANSFVTSATGRSTTSLGVSVGESQLKPPKKVADLSETSEDLYGQNVQTTYGYVGHVGGGENPGSEIAMASSVIIVSSNFSSYRRDF
jgi:hypothetical protein